MVIGAAPTLITPMAVIMEYSFCLTGVPLSGLKHSKFLYMLFPRASSTISLEISIPSIDEKPQEMRASADRPVPQPKSKIGVDLLEAKVAKALAVRMGVIYSFWASSLS